MLTVIRGRSDSIALTKSLIIAAWAVLSCRACPLRRFAPAPPKGEPWAKREGPAEYLKPLPLGEVSPKVTERARMLTVIQGRSDSIALTKSLLIAAWVVLSCRACPLRRFAPALPKGEPFVEEGRPCGISKASPLGRAIEKEKTAKKTLRRKKRLLPDSNRRHPD